MVTSPVAVPTTCGRPTRGGGTDPEALADVVVVGGGAAGLAVALAVAEAAPHLDLVVIDARRPGSDRRTWCSWDDGGNPVPEAVTTSWDRWEVIATDRTVVATDPEHPYRMLRARDYRSSMAARLDGRADIVSGVSARTIGAGRVETTGFAVTAATVVDARGGDSPAALRPGRARLHQRFLGQWIRTERPVFDTTTVTLMDFTGETCKDGVRFVYVLPVSPTEALVEVTAFLRDRTSPQPFRETIARYLRRRWGLGAAEWSVAGEEAGNIPMTDQRPPPGAVTTIGASSGVTRPSTGYAFNRIQRQARTAAGAIAAGRPVPLFVDRWRTRALDAVFLRFLRDQPALAPGAFLRMFGGIPGPITVRFLTERSTLLDELRLVMALPKRPFLRAALTTALDRCGRRR